MSSVRQESKEQAITQKSLVNWVCGSIVSVPEGQVKYICFFVILRAILGETCAEPNTRYSHMKFDIMSVN